MKYYDNIRDCDGVENNIRDATCVPNAMLNFTSSPSFLLECNCPIECDSTYYEALISLSDYPTYKYANYLMNNSLIMRNFPNVTLNKLVNGVF